MQSNLCALSLATLLFTAAPQPAPADPVPNPVRQDLERQARDALGGAVEKKAEEIAARLRGGAGTQAPGDDEDETGGDLESPEEGTSLLLERLSAIEERLCAIEALLTELSARGRAAPPTVATPVSIPSPAAPAVAPRAAVTAGFVKARVRTWQHGKAATIKLSINGLPAGRFDTDTNLDLAPFLQAGRANLLAFSIEPRGGADPTGIDVHVDAEMPGGEGFVAILQFQATKDRLADTFEIPWAPH